MVYPMDISVLVGQSTNDTIKTGQPHPLSLLEASDKRNQEQTLDPTALLHLACSVSPQPIGVTNAILG
jgi:hypothetical protein